MKNLFSIVLLAMVSLCATIETQAQRYNLTVSASDDTLATATGYAYLEVGATQGYKEAISFQYTVVESAAGTLAGTATLEVSDKATGSAATDWFTCPGTAAINLTDVATQSSGWSPGAVAFSRYRIKFTTTGGTGSPTAIAVVKSKK